MATASKATVLTENEMLRRRVLELEAQLAACQPADANSPSAQANAERDDRLEQANAELTLANNALAASQATLQGFYDSAPFMMGIAELDGDKTVAVSANRATAEFLATPPENVPGRTGTALGNPAEFEGLWVEAYRRCQREGLPANFEYAYPHISGRRWLRATAAFIGFGPTDNPRFSFVVEDITERKRAEATLRLAATITDNMAEGANIIRAADGVILHVNARFAKMFGYAPDELIGQNASILNAPGMESPEAVAARIIAHLESHGAWSDDILNRRKDGSTFWCHASVVSFEHPEYGDVWISIHEDITARKRSEENLRKSEELMRMVLENSREGINLLDLRTRRYTFMSPSQVALTGFSTEEMNLFSDEDALARVHPDDRDLSASQKELIAAGKEDLGTTEYRWKVKGGEYRWFSDSRKAVYDPQGQPIALVGVSRDITERKQAEEELKTYREHLEELVQQRTVRLDEEIAERTRTEQALRASEAKFAGIFNLAPLALGLAGYDGRFVDVNETVCDLFGFPREEIIGGTMSELGMMDEAARQKMGAMLVSQGRVKDMELELQTRDGRKRYVTYSINPIVLNDKPHHLGAAVDITDRKEAEQALQESERRFTTVFERSPIAIGISRLSDNRFVDVNPAMCDLMGYAREEMIGHTSLELGLWTDPHERQRLIEQMATQSYAEEFETTNRQKSGRIIDISISAQIAEIDHEKYLLGQIIDITERKRARRQLQALSRQMIETQENERRAIGRELHDEIGQTLTGLKLLLDMAQRLPPEANREKLAQAQAVAGDLIDRVSALSLDLRPPMLDDLGLLPTLLWFVERYASQTTIHVDFHHRGLVDRRFGPAIETAVYRLVQESLTNVGRHAQVADVLVRVTVAENFLDIYVEDAGVGFDVQSVLRRSEGSGLSGMRERVSLLEGALAIDAAPGIGTRITIRLPLIPQEGH